MENQNNIENNSSQMPEFETSKYGITIETKESVWSQMKEMGLKLPTNDEINSQDTEVGDSNLNNLERIIQGIIDDRQYAQNEKIRQQFKGLHVKEYYYNSNLINSYATGFDKTNEEVKDAIFTIFENTFGVDSSELHGEQYIKRTDMLKKLESYFNN